jgi:hypothetical protein
MNETALLATIRDALAAQPGVLIWRNNSGKLQDARGRWVTYGLGVGSADLVGAVNVGGTPENDCREHMFSKPYPCPQCTPRSARFFALEVKTETGKMRTEQECWARAVRSVGGFCATVRSLDEALAALQRCRQGATE